MMVIDVFLDVCLVMFLFSVYILQESLIEYLILFCDRKFERVLLQIHFKWKYIFFARYIFKIKYRHYNFPIQYVKIILD